jgi:hypothetical protein
LYVFGVAAVLLMLAPRPGLAERVLPDVRTLCEPLEIHDGVPDEQACLKELAGVARRDGSALTLKLTNGKTKNVSDARECEACVRYHLVGRIGEGQLILLVNPYECPYLLLVNRRTGDEITLGGWPYLSPSRKRFVVADPRDAGNCGPEYAVGVFSLANDLPRLEWKYTPDGFESYDVDGWNGDNRVQLRAVGADGKQVATDLKLTAQGWQLKRPNGELSLGTTAAPARVNAKTSPTGPAEAGPSIVPLSR